MNAPILKLRLTRSMYARTRIIPSEPIAFSSGRAYFKVTLEGHNGHSVHYVSVRIHGIDTLRKRINARNAVLRAIDMDGIAGASVDTLNQGGDR